MVVEREAGAQLRRDCLEQCGHFGGAALRLADMHIIGLTAPELPCDGLGLTFVEVRHRDGNNQEFAARAAGRVSLHRRRGLR